MSNSFAIPWTVACQAPLSMGFPRQEYLSGLPFPFPGNLPNTGIKPMSPELVDGFFPIEPPGKSKDFRRCSQSLGLFFSSFSHVWVPCAVKMRPRDNIVNAGASNIFKNMVVDPISINSVESQCIKQQKKRCLVGMRSWRSAPSSFGNRFASNWSCGWENRVKSETAESKAQFWVTLGKHLPSWTWVCPFWNAASGLTFQVVMRIKWDHVK